MVAVLPFVAPVTVAGALTVQLKVVPVIVADSKMLVGVFEQSVSTAGVADARGIGFTVMVNVTGLPVQPAGEVGVTVKVTVPLVVPELVIG